MTPEPSSGGEWIECAQRNAACEDPGARAPRLAYTVVLVDDGSGESVGDGEGSRSRETIEMRSLLKMWKRVGDGGFVRAKPERRNLDLKKGSFSVGELVPTEGDPVTRKRYAIELKPGESYTDSVTFELRELPEEGWKVDLQSRQRTVRLQFGESGWVLRLFPID